MKNMLTVVPGAGFDSGVIPAGPLQPGTVMPKRELSIST